MTPNARPSKALEPSEAMPIFACNVGEARGAEEVLTQGDVDYCLLFEPFIRRSSLAGLTEASEHVGVGFRVLAGQAAFCRYLLRSARTLGRDFHDEPMSQVVMPSNARLIRDFVGRPWSEGEPEW